MSANDMMRQRLEEWRRKKEQERQQREISTPQKGPKTPLKQKTPQRPAPLLARPHQDVAATHTRQSLTHVPPRSVQSRPTLYVAPQKPLERLQTTTKTTIAVPSASSVRRPLAHNRPLDRDVPQKKATTKERKDERLVHSRVAKETVPDTMDLVRRLSEAVKGKDGEQNEEDVIFDLQEAVNGSQTPTRGAMLPHIKSFIRSALLLAQEGQIETATRMLQVDIFHRFPGTRINLLASWWMARARVAELSGNFQAVVQLYESARGQPGINVTKLHEGLIRFTQRMQQVASLQHQPPQTSSSLSSDYQQINRDLDLDVDVDLQQHNDNHDNDLMHNLSSELSRRLDVGTSLQSTNHLDQLSTLSSSSSFFLDDKEEEEENVEGDQEEDGEETESEDEMLPNNMDDIPDAEKILKIDSNITATTPERARGFIMRSLHSPFLKSVCPSFVFVETIESASEDTEMNRPSPEPLCFDQHDDQRFEEGEIQEEDSEFVEMMPSLCLKDASNLLEASPPRSQPITPSKRSALCIEPEARLGINLEESGATFLSFDHDTESESEIETDRNDLETDLSLSAQKTKTKISNSFLKQLISTKIDLDEIEKSMADALSHRSPLGSMVLEQETEGAEGTFKTPVRRSARVARKPNTNSKTDSKSRTPSLKSRTIKKETNRETESDLHGDDRQQTGSDDGGEEMEGSQSKTPKTGSKRRTRAKF